ncbi:hypothetical protein HG536_0D04610 [Torulaspora globosa]|uniref:Mediator of RNA polymerase II transcription subunit 3 n=1 Tax=Torulaspora globosa TaxID=48254 RepID=A0A7G3ZHF3_9SACH|nr:uncharacterized protein HG536_0D04610 [Torulaspora globosa]QLL32939.1 hypothetical protein HG536_0D04610 [Torulaspora globosa]
MSSLADLLSPDLKLDDLEASLAGGTKEPQEKVISAIDKAQGSILPMRLQFNDFLQTMSSLDDLQDQTPLERFALIRNKVLDLTNRLQMISEDVGKLQPLFDTIPEYSERYGTKKFQPLETLKVTSQNSTISTPQTQNSGASNPPASKKISKSSGGTPVSHSSTPLGSAAPSTFPAAGKKPRKPRQSKKAQAAAAAAAAAVDTVKSQPSTVLSPTPPAHMINSAPPANPMQMMNGVMPNTMTGSPMQSLMSPVGNTPNGYGLPQQQMQLPQSQQQPQQFNQPTVGNSAPPVQPLNMNSITPANILNMSMGADPQQQQPIQNNPRKNFDPLDFNNLDFGDLNMDMI